MKWLFNVFCFALFGSDIDFDSSGCHHLSYAQIIRNIPNMKLMYCFFLNIFQVEGFHKVIICYLQVVLGGSLLVVGGFKSFFACCRSFQAVS